MLEEETIDENFHFEGSLPVVRAVMQRDEELSLIQRFIREASTTLQLDIDACAVLCPTNEAAQDIAHQLTAKQIPATYMSRDNFDLAHPTIKVMTLHAAKGLEFPIVISAGFFGRTNPGVSGNMGIEERENNLNRERRTLYVGMTRAMRALLIITPSGEVSSVLTGFDPQLWNIGP